MPNIKEILDTAHKINDTMNKHFSNPSELEKTLDLCAYITALWVANKNPDYIDESEKDDMISKIIYLRTAKYDVKIRRELGLLISLCSNGNPGMAIIIYYHFLDKISKSHGLLPHGYEITTKDFIEVYGDAFPCMEDPKQEAFFKDLWDKQKDEKGNNNVDKMSYWDKLFVES